MKIKKIKTRLNTFPLALCLLFISAMSGIAYASVASPQAIAQGYSSSFPLQPGMIVMLSNNTNQVQPLDMSNIRKMLGVVISSSGAAITLGSTKATNQAYVTNYGLHDVLVSNQNGPVKTGDYITISSLNGVGMDAGVSEPIVLGQATGKFSGSSNIVGSANLSSSGGGKMAVNYGLVPVDIAIANNPLDVGPQGIPAFLSKLTRFATKKSVSATRVYLTLFIVLVGIIVAVTIIYSGVKNGIISLGRNPLAKKVIYGSIIRTALIGIAIFALSLAAAYLILQ